MSDVILVEREAHIATLVLNRPEKLNALTRPMWARLGETVRALWPTIACVVSWCAAPGTSHSPPATISPEFAATRSNSTQAKAYGEVHHAALAASPSAATRRWR